MIHVHTATPDFRKGSYYVECKLNWLSFNIPCDTCTTLWFEYDRADGALNIQQPQLPPVLPTVYDAIWDLRERPTKFAASPVSADEFTDLKAEHWMQLEDIPPGLSLNDICKKQANKAWVPKRLGYMSPAPTRTLACQRWLHPRQHRTLTLAELNRIFGFGLHPARVLTIPELVAEVPPPILSWASAQQQMGEQCWESTFNRKKNKWEGQTFDETPQTKIFDLRQLVSNKRLGTEYPLEMLETNYTPASGGYIWRT